MHNVTTSRHIRSATELFIMVPIKNDFVPISELVLTYEGRVSTVLKLLGELRQQKIERGFGEPADPIELLNTIYRVQWSVLKTFDDVQTSKGELKRQLKQRQILLTSHFDSSWEDYFRALVDIGGPLLDLIFSHCEGYEGHSCKDCVLDGVKARRGHAGGEAAEQRQWVHLHRQGSVGKRALECDAYQAFGPALDALVGDGWSQHVTQ
jgi:hypothetical protein